MNKPWELGSMGSVDSNSILRVLGSYYFVAVILVYKVSDSHGAQPADYTSPIN